MEKVLWTIYGSGMVPVLGYLVMLPVGIVMYGWWALLAWWNLIEVFQGVGTFGQWLKGPCSRFLIVGPFIYLLGVLLNILVIPNFFLGWWANLDYYSYSYELFNGPVLPGAETAE